jgi:hypothetical protein
MSRMKNVLSLNRFCSVVLLAKPFVVTALAMQPICVFIPVAVTMPN